MKICIVKVSSIGDVSHTSFVPHLIKKHIPYAEIHWFCDQKFTEIIAQNPSLNKINSVLSRGAKQSLFKFIKQFSILKKHAKQEKYDVVIDFQGTFKSALISRALCTNNNLWGFKNTRDIVANKFYKKSCNIPLQTNVYRRAVSIINNALNINASTSEIKTPFLFCNEKNQIQNQSIIIFPSSSKSAKNYSVENYRKLLLEIHKNYKITLLYGSNAEKKMCKEVSKGFDNINIVGNMQLEAVKNIISQTKCVIGGDTGILHIASALGVKNITLYGPTPAYRTSIHQKHSIALQGNGDVNKIPIKEITKALNFLKI
jgi:heptosyltransferase-1